MMKRMTLMMSALFLAIFEPASKMPPPLAISDLVKGVMEEHAKETDKRTLQTITKVVSALQSEIVAINVKAQKSDAHTDKLEAAISNLQSTMAAMAKQIDELQSTQTQQKKHIHRENHRR